MRLMLENFSLKIIHARGIIFSFNMRAIHKIYYTENICIFYRIFI